MNQDTDKEIEILLRRQPRRRGASIMSGAMGDARAKSDAPRAEAHMDADELSAYAEGALPERARSRYAAHLADCDACRKVVTDLVIASNVASNIGAEEKGTVAQTVAVPGRSWREWFSSLFSPPVLRFALPALALILISAIVFIIATRRSADQAPFVARNQEPRSQTSTTSVANQNRESSSNDEPVSADNHGNTATTNTSSAVETNTNAASQQKQPVEGNARTLPEPPPQPQQDGTVANAPKAAAAPVAEQPAVAQERKEAQPSKPALANEPSDKVLDRAREKDEELAAKNKSSEEAAGGIVPATSGAGASVNSRRSRGNAGTASNNAVGAASEAASDDRQRNETAKSLPAARSKRDAAGADADSNSTSTRTVAGKRFRQQNGVWIDTTYNSSRPLTTVRRGTEQYRALVADEPVIATAANEFGNCIIVVKGRAYHVY